MPYNELHNYRIFRLFPSEWALLREIELDRGLSAITPHVPDVDLSKADDRRPIRLKLPTELNNAIRRVLKTKAKRMEQQYVDILLAAARRYREMHPFSKENWQEPDYARYARAERERRQDEGIELKRRKRVFRLSEKDREMLQDLGRGRDDSITRHDALCELTAIVKDMHREGAFDEIKQHQRKSCRIDIPLDLKTAIDARVRDGDKFLTVLMAAAREYQRQHSPNPED
jgi:hypothetical protein